MDNSLGREWFKQEGAKINIVDTTLRDGNGRPEWFRQCRKNRIARFLDSIGVDQIEAGIPVMGGFEKSASKIVDLGLKASIMAWNRAVISDIKESLCCGWMLWLYPFPHLTLH